MNANGRHGLIAVGLAAALTGATPSAADKDIATKDGGCATCGRSPRSGERGFVTPATRRAPAHGPYAREIAAASARYAVPERLIWAMIHVESGFDRRAVSPKGARGLMQLMPRTAALLGVRDPFDPRQNIDAGTRHLRGLMVRFRHDVRLALAAYNAGEGPVLQHRGIPPYPETRQYVAQVLRLYEAPVRQVELRDNGVRRILEPDGTVVYTNVAYGDVGTRFP